MWKASGAVSADGTTTISVAHPIKNKDSLAQYQAALASCEQIGPILGSSQVDIKGNGYSYPTSMVNIAVTTVVDNDNVGQSWDAVGAVPDAGKVADLEVSPELTDPVAIEQFKWALQAATELVASGTIGNIRPTQVRLSGHSGSPISQVTVLVHRPVAEGYKNTGAEE